MAHPFRAVVFPLAAPIEMGHHPLARENIFKERELEADPVTEDFSATATDGKNYNVRHYNLDAIIAVGYRVNSGHTAAELIVNRADHTKERMGLTTWAKAPPPAARFSKPM